MTLILLEGPDCAGKTTLAHALTKPEHIFHSTYVGRGRQEMHTMDNFIAGFNCSRAGNVAVLDRGWIGQDVYASVFRPYDPNADWTKRHHAIATACRCYTVLCAPDPVKVQEAFVEEQKTSGRVEMYKSTLEVAKLYRYLATCLSGEWLNFNSAKERNELYDCTRNINFTKYNYVEKLARNRATLLGFSFYDRFYETPEEAAKRILAEARAWGSVR